MVISISGGSPTSTATTITWTTGDYDNSTVNYGTTTSLGTYAGSETFELSHSVSLSGLTASTLYYFRAISCDINANCNPSGLNYNLYHLQLIDPRHKADIYSIAETFKCTADGESTRYQAQRNFNIAVINVFQALQIP